MSLFGLDGKDNGNGILINPLPHKPDPSNPGYGEGKLPGDINHGTEIYPADGSNGGPSNTGGNQIIDQTLGDNTIGGRQGSGVIHDDPLWLIQEDNASQGIVGIDRPFRPENPNYPANTSIIDKINGLNINETTDCSDIARIVLALGKLLLSHLNKGGS